MRVEIEGEEEIESRQRRKGRILKRRTLTAASVLAVGKKNSI